jgi:hypothetical protein
MQTSNSNQADEEWDRLTEEMESLEGMEAGMALYEASKDPAQRERYYNKWISYSGSTRPNARREEG